MNARTAHLIEEECNRIVAKLANQQGSECRAVTAIVKRLLLNAPYFYNGHSINPQAKAIGAGVYIVTAKKED